MNKIQTVKNGFNKKWDSNSDFDEDKCPFCNASVQEARENMEIRNDVRMEI